MLLPTETYYSSSFYTSINTQEVLINDFVYKEICELQVYTYIPEMKVRENDVVMDVGAHIGIFSRFAALQGSKRVIAFEMDPRHFVCLKQNVREQDDVFNCILLNKNLSKFKLENEVVVNGFDLNHFYSGGLFDKIDFMKVDVSGNEKDLFLSIPKTVYDVIKKISIRCYTKTNVELLKDFLYSNGYQWSYNIVIPDHPIQFLYVWK